MTNNKMANEQKFDLEERTAKFGEEIVHFVKCGTSIGANYCEADDAESRRDFKHDILPALKSGVSLQRRMTYQRSIHLRNELRSVLECCYKIGICKKEARETKHFLRMSAIAVEQMAERARKLWREAREINLIFNAIYKKL